MRLLGISLLIFFCRTSLVLSDFTHLTLKCTTENDGHLKNCKTDSCIWNMNLADCDTLQLQCTDTNNRKNVCDSLEECGMANGKEFVKNLLGHIQCEFHKGERSGLQAGQLSTQTLLLRSHAVVIAAKKIECMLRVLCKDMEYIEHVCKREYCGMKHINSSHICKFNHTIKKCIHGNEKFPIKGDLNCSTESIPDNDPLGQTKYNSVCTPNPDGTNTGYKNATITLGVISGVLILACIFLIWKVCYTAEKRKKGPEVHRESKPEEIIKLNELKKGDSVDNEEDVVSEEN